MTKKLVGALAALTLIATACGSGENVVTTTPSTVTTTAQAATSAAPSTTPSTEAPTPVTEPSAAPAAAGTIGQAALVYSLAQGDVLTYDMTMSMDMTMDIGGLAGVDPAAPSGPVAMTFDVAMTVTHDIADGPEPGSYRIRQAVTDLSVLGGTMTAEGETLTIDDPIELAAIFPADDLPYGGTVEFVIGADGTVLDVESPDLGLPMDPFGGQSMFGIGTMGTEYLFGPALPDGDVAVGDTWTDVAELQLLPGQPTEVMTSWSIVGEEPIGGVQTFVIEMTRDIPPMTMSLGDIVDSGALASEDLGGLDPSFFGDFDISYAIEATRGTGTFWFDPAGGRVMRQTFASPIEMDMEMAGFPFLPEDELDGPITMTMALELSGVLDLVV